MKHSAVLMLAAVMVSSPVVQAKKQFGPAVPMQQSGQLPAAAVERYIINPFGEVDGLLLSDGSLVKFPAHQSDELTAVIKPGDIVVVGGMSIGQGVVDAWRLTNTASNAIIVRTPKSKLAPKLPKHLRAMSLQHMEARGRIAHLVHGKKGEVKLAVLDDGTALRLGKQAQWVIGSQLAVGREVVARGVGTESALGRGLEVTELGVDNGPVLSLYGTKR